MNAINDNRTRREIKSRYLRRRADVQLELDRKQVELTYAIETAMNERIALIARQRVGEDMHAELDTVTARLRSLRMEKIDLDYRRKIAVAEVNEERDRVLRAHEETVEQREEVAAV